MITPEQQEAVEEKEPVGPAWLFHAMHTPKSRGYHILHGFLNVIIFLCAIIGALETVGSIHSKYEAFFHYTELAVAAGSALPRR